MSTHDIHRTDPRLLAGLMELDTASESPCPSPELATILRHQLNAPLDIDLRSLDGEGLLAARHDPSLRSFRDLLSHPCPPVALLELVKQFAKGRGGNGAAVLPEAIGTALYFTVVVVSLARTGRRITSLDDAGVRSGADWLMSQSWVDAETKALVREYLAAFPGGQHKKPSDR